MPNKYQWYVGSLFLLVVSTAACAPRLDVSDETVTVSSATAPIPAASNQTPVSNSVAKQNDLIFVEFFAGA